MAVYDASANNKSNRNSRRYRDIDLDFGRNSTTNDIVKIEDVVNSIIELLNSNIKNQKIILVSKNIKFLDFLYFLTKKNNYKQYYLKIPKYIFIILIALEKIFSVLLLRKSRLSSNLLNSLFNDYEIKGTDISKKLKLKYSKIF